MRAGARAPFRLTVRTIQVGLGVVWILDGLLQLQPRMFTTTFATQVLAPSARGQPGFLAWPEKELVRLVSHQPAAFTAVIAAAQLLLGIGMLARSTVKPALALSLAWVAWVWALGEGFGMLFTGAASPLTGAPGAVLLYGIIALVAWPRKRPDPRTGRQPQSAAAGGVLGETGTRVAWAVLWVGMAALWLQPANRSQGSVSGWINGAASAAPWWLGTIDRQVAHGWSDAGPGLALTLAVVSLVVGLGPLITRRPTIFLVAGSALSLGFWFLGQSLGGLTTGLATDVNSGPLYVFFALALFPNRAPTGYEIVEPRAGSGVAEAIDVPTVVPTLPIWVGVGPEERSWIFVEQVLTDFQGLRQDTRCLGSMAPTNLGADTPAGAKSRSAGVSRTSAHDPGQEAGTYSQRGADISRRARLGAPVAQWPDPVTLVCQSTRDTEELRPKWWRGDVCSDVLVPTRLLSNNKALVDHPLPLRDILTGLAEGELPGHMRQLLALLPDGAAASAAT